jgi:extracellular elastinolytic metalloproteinase
MRCVFRTAAVALFATKVFGHPAASPSSARDIQKRIVDLSAYKIGVGAKYTSNVVITEQGPGLRSITASDYTTTATSLVKSTFPEAEFRLVSNYVSGNGIGHVVFKQTVHGIDIDTADFNVNVRL